ncbi:hypothetical protein N0V88_001978 [Collariella sp. IMI 366227]|nr:hypothetical protein N0V88_001978 [Collariella sp. IMI 366227]
MAHEPRSSWLNKDLGKFPGGIIYLPGQEEKLYEDSDMGPEFRQRRHFYYMSGADFPGCAVTYDIERDQLILWIPYTDPRTVLWYGRTPSPKQCMAHSHVDDVRYIQGLQKTLIAAISSQRIIYCLHRDQVPPFEIPDNVSIDTSDLAPAIDRARVIKTEYEIEMIRRANAVSSAAHRVIMSRIKGLRNERQIDAVFHYSCHTSGAKRQAYPVIAASGINGSTLHYNDNDQPLAGRQLVVLDAGAEWNCYASDVTRTFPISGQFSPQAAAIYRLVERMQVECIERICPGMMFHSLHLHACAVAVIGLLELGILRGGSPAKILSHGTIAAFFPHGLGHHVGLEVHDVSGAERLLFDVPSRGAPVSPLRGDGLTGCRAGSKRALYSADMLGSLYRDALHTGQMPMDASYLAKGGKAMRFGEVEDQTHSPMLAGKQKLEKGMVVTVEPGIYFCREYLEQFLNHPVHSQFIDKFELEKFYDVGGVRIEDDILVTEEGYENLTTAPKGEEMLKVINKR